MMKEQLKCINACVDKINTLEKKPLKIKIKEINTSTKKQAVLLQP